MKHIYGYKTFPTTEEFQKWQRDMIAETGTTPRIHQISPIVSGMGGGVTDTDANFESRISVFVVYVADCIGENV